MESSLVNGKLWASVQVVVLFMITCTLVVMMTPDSISRVPSRRAEGFLPPSWYQRSPDGTRYALGTDYLGRPFVPVLVQASSATMRLALAGTALALLGCLIVGVIHGSTRSRGLEALVAAGNLGAMAVPEAAVLITLATAWPRTAPAAYVNASMLAVLVAFAVPTGARLIAERVRAVGRTGFVAASRAYGASYAYTFRHDIWPHLLEDVAWIVASVLPRFVAIEVGMAFVGVEYRDLEGLGRTLAKSFNNLSVGTAVFQMLVTIAVILWVALTPQFVLNALGVRAAPEVIS
jgi:peptide/nickel transport system permease protein